jgi:uncharacterized membrane protein YgdD (TMEM256/DUF423 family)
MPPFWTIGTLFGASSVMLGAFGAHGLKKRIADPARIGNWGTAAQYQVCLPLCLIPLLFPLSSSPRVAGVQCSIWKGVRRMSEICDCSLTLAIVM